MNLLIVDDEVITTQVLKEKLILESAVYLQLTAWIWQKNFAERKCGNYPVRCGNASRERSGAFGMGSQ